MRWLPLLLLLPWASLAGASDCPPLIDVPCVYDRPEGFVWFGLRGDGVVVSVGQTVTLECPSSIAGVELQFDPTSGTLVAGDPVRLAIMSTDARQCYAEIARPMPSRNTWGSVYFDFSGAAPQLEPGSHLIGATTDVPRYTSMAYCRIGLAYGGGDRMISYGGLNGPWWPDAGLDLRFRLYLEAAPVPTMTTSWSGLKAQYHARGE